MITSTHTFIRMVPTRINGLCEKAGWKLECSPEARQCSKPRNASARSILASGSKAYDGRTDNSGFWMKKPFAVWL